MTMQLVRRTAVLAIATGAFVACTKATTPAATSPAPATAVAVAAAPKLPAGVTLAMIAQGDSIFNTASCQKCHGKGGVGAANGPNLTSGKWEHGSGTYEDIVATITSGVPADEIVDKSHRFNMRPRGGVQPLLTDDQVKAVGAYVYSLTHK